MIYSTNKQLYPTKGQFMEESRYFDENGFEWNIARVNNGFFVKYEGDEYFSEKYFYIELNNGKRLKITNTNCLFVKCVDFDTFYHFRDILKNGFTDDIWDIIEELFLERFNQDEGFIESEEVEIL